MRPILLALAFCSYVHFGSVTSAAAGYNKAPSLICVSQFVQSSDEGHVRGELNSV